MPINEDNGAVSERGDGLMLNVLNCNLGCGVCSILAGPEASGCISGPQFPMLCHTYSFTFQVLGCDSSCVHSVWFAGDPISVLDPFI